MHRSLAILFGVVFIIFGILGFLPSLMVHGQLFGIFRLNFEHNAAHLTLGILGVLAGLASKIASKTYFFLAGAIYAALAILGFLEKGEMLLQMIAVNPADNYLHAGLGALFLAIGLKPSK